MKKLVLNKTESQILQRDGSVYVIRNGFDILVEKTNHTIGDDYIITTIFSPYKKVVVTDDKFDMLVDLYKTGVLGIEE